MPNIYRFFTGEGRKDSYIPDMSKKNSAMITFRSVVITLCFILPAWLTSAQKEWTLEDCIGYAHENNLRIQRQKLLVRSAESDLLTARSQTLPTANAFGNYTFNKGRAPNFDTYEYVDQAFQDGNVGIESRLNLFAGLSTYNAMRQNHFNLLARLEDVEDLKNNITILIGGAYLQILLNKELLKIAEDQLAITRQQVQKNERLVEVGNLSRGDLYEIQAQEAREAANVVAARNDLEISYLNLAQYMDLDTNEIKQFSIVIPELAITDASDLRPVDSVYSDALKVMPMVKSAEYNLLGFEKGLSAARGDRYPSLSARYLYYTLYSEISVSPEDPTAPYRWQQQLQDKGYQQLSFSLEIPLFNRFNSQNRISHAKVSMLDAKVNLEQTKQTMYKNIQQAYADAQAALEYYNANLEAVMSTEESFNYTQQKFNVGMVSSVDYNLSKNNLTKAQSDLLQAKFQYIFYTKILDFWAGKPIRL
jgi:outer membrane protein